MPSPPITNSGSRWLRWEPHIHAPGTVLNNQFKGATAWQDYLAALEAAAPTIRALGVTDYYSTDTYEQVVKHKASGRLTGCDLIFPNIEMRLALGTVKGRWVNIHLLVSPDDPDHLGELKRLLARLSFEAHDDSFNCSREDLIRLGRKADAATSEAAAFARGCEQFKVSFDQLRETYSKSTWAQQNIIVGVAGSEGDGTSGVRDGSDQTLRAEVEKFAHVIFASSAAQREFWLGQGSSLTAEQIIARYGGLKPCIHGSDAHSNDRVAAPIGDRFCWIKGAPEFDALRQAYIDPAGRAYVGPEPPVFATTSQIIQSIEISGAPWAQTTSIAVNPGLVAIIGARGSGKTALADMIALGCDATSDRLSEASFLVRAQPLLSGASVRLNWASGDQNDRKLDQSDAFFADEYPRARYLSQKFVEELCSAQGMTDALLREIERVVFESHALADRDGAADFDELLELRATRHRNARERQEDSLADISERIGTDLEKEKLVPDIKKQIREKTRLIEGYRDDQAKLVTKGGEARAKRLAALTAEAETVRGYLRYFSSREQSLLSLQDEVSNFRTHQAPEALRRVQERYRPAAIKAAEWQPFLLDYSGDVDGSVTAHLKETRDGAKTWKGTRPAAGADINTPLIPDSADITQQPLALLEAEIARLEKLISVDRDTAKRFATLTKRITEENTALTRLKQRLEDCEGAAERVKQLVQEREDAYARVFDAVLAEERVLAELHQPLMNRLKDEKGTLTKLAFSISRIADVEAWAKAGETLLDLRHKGPFKGKGSLAEITAAALKPAWESGDSAAVTAAMAKFRAEHQSTLLGQAPVPKSDQADYRAWTKRFAKWLYGTEHIRIQYGIDYDGTDIRKLSPGTRGIVLLLLYLALDDTDDRPLIIDQPEENLDPKSVYDELVSLFIRAKTKRQVIIVTHNANLVVNTDADQIFIAEAGPHKPGELPPITYVSGGLESAAIRKAVCDTLEGGERAFQERAARLRVSLKRYRPYGLTSPWSPARSERL
jgi:ABC-type lipoprotein export system ATPase subunit